MREEYLEDDERLAKNRLKELVTQLRDVGKRHKMLLTQATIDDVSFDEIDAKCGEGDYYRTILKGVKWERIFGPIPQPSDDGFVSIRVYQEWANEPEPAWIEEVNSADNDPVKAADYDVAVRRGLVKAMEQVYPHAKGKNLDELTCKELDDRRVSIIASWEDDYGIDIWVEGYDHPDVKPLIQRMFSADRKTKQ